MLYTTSPLRFARFGWLLPLLLLLAPGACGPESEAAPELTSQERLNNAAARIERITSVDFTLSHEEGHTPLMVGVALNQAEGTAQDPDQASMRVEAMVSGINAFIAMKITVDGEDATMTDPLSGKPLPLAASALPVNLHNLGDTLGGILLAITGPAYSGEQTLDGVASRGIAGRVRGADIQPLIPGAEAGLEQAIEVWVGDDDLVRQVRITGRLLANDPDPVVRVLRFSAFDEAGPAVRAT